MHDPLWSVSHKSRDVTWLKRMCFEKEALPAPDVCDVFDDVVPLSSEGADSDGLQNDLVSLSGTIHDALGPDADMRDDSPTIPMKMIPTRF